MFWTGFLIGIVIGGMLGIFVICLCIYAREMESLGVQKRSTDPEPGHPFKEWLKRVEK